MNCEWITNKSEWHSDFSKQVEHDKYRIQCGSTNIYRMYRIANIYMKLRLCWDGSDPLLGLGALHDTCLPSMVPMIWGKFHLFNQSSEIWRHSCSVVGQVICSSIYMYSSNMASHTSRATLLVVLCGNIQTYASYRMSLHLAPDTRCYRVTETLRPDSNRSTNSWSLLMKLWKARCLQCPALTPTGNKCPGPHLCQSRVKCKLLCVVLFPSSPLCVFVFNRHMEQQNQFKCPFYIICVHLKWS